MPIGSRYPAGEYKPRRAHDLYPTPVGWIKEYIDKWWMVGPPMITPLKVLDAGMGDGRWGYYIKQKFPLARVDGVDIRSVDQPSWYDNIWCEDFLTWEAPIKYDAVIGNPPYSHATEFVKKAHEVTGGGGSVSFLLRIDFLGSGTRFNNLWPDYPLNTLLVSARRPSFDGTGNTDTYNYAMFGWAKSNIHTSFRGSWFNWEYDPDDLWARG